MCDLWGQIRWLDAVGCRAPVGVWVRQPEEAWSEHWVRVCWVVVVVVCRVRAFQRGSYRGGVLPRDAVKLVCVGWARCGLQVMAEGR